MAFNTKQSKTFQATTDKMPHSSRENWQAGKNVLECNRFMLSNELYCDVLFKVGDMGTEIKTHKYVLASRSDVFAAMLYGNLSEDSDFINTPDIEPEIFRAILRFVYYEEKNITENNVTRIIYAAEKYGITELFNDCQLFFESNITEDNVCVIMENAAFYNMKELFSKCQNFVYESIFVSRKALKSLSYNHLGMQCLVELIGSDRLPLNEKTIFDLLLHRAKAMCKNKRENPEDPTELRKMLGDLLFHIRFPVMAFDIFMNEIVPTKILSDDETAAISNLILGEHVENCVFKMKNRNLTINLYRFKKTSAPTWNWTLNGEEDAIDFEANKPILLHGILLYGSPDVPYRYDVKVRISSVTNKNSYLLQTPLLTVTGSEQIFPIEFDNPCQIHPNERYKISVRMKGPNSFFGDFCESCTHGDFSIRFFESSYTGNGTCELFGQIPGLVCRLNV